MEEDMEMEMGMETEWSGDIDPDYEYDAAMYFDFTREESSTAALEVERWFNTAPCYSPSPFAKKLLLGDESKLEDVSESLKPTLVDDDCCGGQEGHSVIELNNREESTHDFCAGKLEAKLKSRAKGYFCTSSTLMKPTASVLAKQSNSLKTASSRFKVQVVESQAAKRQKLEGGLLRKIGVAKQQTNFIHKLPKKDVQVERSRAQPKTRPTIPREPKLATTYRAERMRPKTNPETQMTTSDARRFKARPLNRKILEAPSLAIPKKSTLKLPDFCEFHLRTSERAMQHSSVVLTSSRQCNDNEKGYGICTTASLTESKRSIAMDTVKEDAFGTTHILKARALNTKEFNLHTEKRTQHHPPVDQFSKLSLGQELQTNNESESSFPRQSSMFGKKGSKENKMPMQPGNKEPWH